MQQGNRLKSILYFLITVAGAVAGLFLAISMNRNILPTLSQPWRAVLAIVIQWAPALIPILMAILSQDNLVDLGFRKEKIGCQIGIGILIGASLSLILTILPILFGLKDLIGRNKGYDQAWKYLYELLYCVAGVALSEELVFRGIMFHRVLAIKDSKVFAILLSSAAFGLFHVFSGNVVQMLTTALIGAFLCICREKIKNCSTLSLIFAHGLYDALIVVWCAVL